MSFNSSSTHGFSHLRKDATTCSFAEDNAFGPAISSKCRAFDFTLLFEQAFLSLLPSILLALLSVYRIFTIYNYDVKTLPSHLLHGSKLASTGCYTCLQLAVLIVVALPSTPRTALSLIAASSSFIASILICILSWLEHRRSVQPSALLNVYLLFSTIFDCAQLRTLWYIHGLGLVASLFSAGLAIKVSILVLEAWEKKDILSPKYRHTTREGRSGIYSRSLFWWLNGLFTIGFRRVLTLYDLYHLEKEMSSEVLAQNARITWAQADKERKHALFWTIFSCLKWPLLRPVLPRLAKIGFSYSQPFLINRVINFVGDNNPTSNDRNVGYGLVGAASLIYIGLAISNGRYQHGVFKSITMVRGTLSTLIYEKTLDLHYVVLDHAAPVTLMSTDVDSITNSLDQLHEIWASTIEVFIAMYLLGSRSGVGCITPIVLAAAGTAANTFWVGPVLRDYRPTWNRAIQQRVSLTASILRDMKALKMLGLTKRIRSLLQSQRRYELERSKAVRLMVVWLNMFANLMETFASAFVLMAVALLAQARGKEPIKAAEAYTILSLISLVSSPLLEVTAAIPGFMGGLGCFDRIQEYLLLQSQNDDRLLDNELRISPSSSAIELGVLHTVKNVQTERDAIILDRGSFGYAAEKLVLHDLSINLKAGWLTMIVGPVGSGKTGLLLALLGEIKSIQGFVRMKSDIAYCQQSAWLPNDTIQNIVVGIHPYEETWYQKVTYSCGLDIDISHLPHQSQTMIGSRGISLSGGQRQRLSLARAVYARKSIMLLDDVFSGLDVKTQGLLFSRLMSPSGLLKQQRTTVLLVTHTVQYLHNADYIIALDSRGRITEQGTFPALMLRQGYVKTLAVKAQVTRPEEGREVVYSQIEATTPGLQDPTDTNELRRNGDFSLYRYYAECIGPSRLLLFLALQFARGSCSSVPQLWVQYWSKAHGRDTNMYISVLFLFASGTFVFAFAAMWFMLIRIVPRSGLKLHWTLLSVVMAAPLSFFATTDAGIILNRFSQDMTIIDTLLPISVMQIGYVLCEIIWNAALICYGSYYLTAFIPILMLVLYTIQKFYLRTSRQMRLLDLEMKSPLFTHFTETQEGLVTIRAFGWQSGFLERFLQKLDASQRPYYLLYMIQQWLGFCLSMVVAAIAIVCVAFATSFKHQSSGSAIGIALLNIINFSSSLTQLISSWTQLETSIGAIARLKQLQADVLPEQQASECQIPPLTWPSNGSINFKNVSARYTDSGPDVLQKVNLSIAPGERIGICGRTGSGKSTLVALLFCLLPVREGGIVSIDGVDLAQLPQELVRSSIIAIPQEPYLLEGTVRFNAAPRSAVFAAENEPDDGTANEESFLPPPSDAAIVAALEKVGLWTLIASRGGLSTLMSAIGLSHGQKQLFCLARALLLKSTPSNASFPSTTTIPTPRILVLDEATASVDAITDAHVREVVRTEFDGFTIVCVAHRLETLSRCDRVVVLDRGRVVEVGSPESLAKVEGGWWRELWEAQN